MTRERDKEREREVVLAVERDSLIQYKYHLETRFQRKAAYFCLTPSYAESDSPTHSYMICTIPV
jgi:hypothetical protein